MTDGLDTMGRTIEEIKDTAVEGAKEVNADKKEAVRWLEMALDDLEYEAQEEN